jgi:hypothetical protein
MPCRRIGLRPRSLILNGEGPVHCRSGSALFWLPFAAADARGRLSQNRTIYFCRVDTPARQALGTASWPELRRGRDVGGAGVGQSTRRRTRKRSMIASACQGLEMMRCTLNAFSHNHAPALCRTTPAATPLLCHSFRVEKMAEAGLRRVQESQRTGRDDRQRLQIQATRRIRPVGRPRTYRSG